MAEINQYSLSLRELVELVVKQQEIHEGEWALMLGFGIGTSAFGPSPDQSFPGAMVTLNQVGIQRVMPGLPLQNPTLVIDAAKVNPRIAEKPTKKKRRPPNFPSEP
jgi:hypothetical protein